MESYHFCIHMAIKDGGRMNVKSKVVIEKPVAEGWI